MQFKSYAEQRSSAIPRWIFGPWQGLSDSELYVQVGRDPRDVMRAAYTVFQEGALPERELQEADPRRSHDAFYANLVRHCSPPQFTHSHVLLSR